LESLAIVWVALGVENSGKLSDEVFCPAEAPTRKGVRRPPRPGFDIAICDVKESRSSAVRLEEEIYRKSVAVFRLTALVQAEGFGLHTGWPGSRSRITPRVTERTDQWQMVMGGGRFRF